MIIKCSADNKDCDQSITVNYTVSQDYGNCFSFTYKKPVTTSGKNYGLQIWYNLEAYDSLGLFTATSGLKLFLTTPGLIDRNGNVFVDLTSELSLPPGFEHMVSVQPNNVQKLVEPYSTCENYGEGTVHIYNTRDDCLRHCVNLYVHYQHHRKFFLLTVHELFPSNARNFTVIKTALSRFLRVQISLS